MNTQHSLTQNAPSVNKVAAAFLIALVAALLTIAATGGRSQAQETSIITVGPADVGFGAVEVGQTAERDIFVRNNGDTALALDLTALGLDPLGDFAVELPALGNVLNLAPGEESTITIQFSPTVAGDQIADLDFAAAGGGAGAPTVSLQGTGTNYNPLDPNQNPNPGVQSDCTIVGTDNNDQLTGTAANDVICALGGNDAIDGQGGNDELRGENGRDKITDKSGTDKLIGGAKRDRLNSKDGSPGDTIMGGPGKDRIIKDKKDRGRS